MKKKPMMKHGGKVKRKKYGHGGCYDYIIKEK